MSDSFSFELVSPEKLLLSESVQMVVVPGAEGDFGVLIGHSPLISSLRPGVIDTYVGDKIDKRIFVAGGFAEVTTQRCTVLAEEAIYVSAIDRQTAQARLTAAQNAIEVAVDENARGKAEGELAIAVAMSSAGDAA